MESVYKILLASLFFAIGFLFNPAQAAPNNITNTIGMSCVGKTNPDDYCQKIFLNQAMRCDGATGQCKVPTIGGQTSETGGQTSNIAGSPPEIGGQLDPNIYYFGSYAGKTSAELICSVTNLISQTLLPPIAVLMALVVGFLFLTSRGEPQKISLATKVLYGTLVGVFLLLVAPGIIALINDLFGSNITAPACDPAVTTSTIIKALLNLVNLFAWFSAVVAVAMGLYSGFLYLTARGNPQQARQAAMTLSYTIIGIAVSVAAFSIITIVEQFIGYP